MKVKLVRRNLVRFFKDGNECTRNTYYDIPIPQRKSIVWLNDKPYRVDDISYSYYDRENDGNMIDISVHEVDLESL
jgi:hypothetical protein